MTPKNDNEQAIKTFYIRKGQPHIVPIGACFSVVMLAHDAVPAPKLEALRQERAMAVIALRRNQESDDAIAALEAAYTEKMEDLLNAKHHQEYPFRNAEAARILMERIQLYDGKYYRLDAACVMPNHLHLLLDFSIQLPENWAEDSPVPGYQPLHKALGQIKGASARLINRAQGRSGELWSKGYYDRYIRNAWHWHNEYNYIANNPVCAGLVNDWALFPYTYLRQL
ncbi:MAG: transposase [Saprospiraceae bacterium]